MVVYPPYIVCSESLINPSFVDCLLGRRQQCFGFPTFEFSNRRNAQSIA
jgi:hypothetical protein